MYKDIKSSTDQLHLTLNFYLCTFFVTQNYIRVVLGLKLNFLKNRQKIKTYMYKN
jgi:hypothetical protein